MTPVTVNVYILMMLLAYVMRRAGTFSLDEKVKLIEYLGYMALNPNRVANPSMANLPFLSSASGVKDQNSSSSKPLTVMADAAARVVTTPVAANAYIGSSHCWMIFSPDIIQSREPQRMPCIAARPLTTSAKRAALFGTFEGVGTGRVVDFWDAVALVSYRFT